MDINFNINQIKYQINSLCGTSELPISVIILILKDILNELKEIEQEYLESVKLELLKERETLVDNNNNNNNNNNSVASNDNVDDDDDEY